MAQRNPIDPRQTPHRDNRQRRMNATNRHADAYRCPIPGCAHSSTGTAPPFTTKLALLHHINAPSHRNTHHLMSFPSCTTSDIYQCCRSDCPSSQKRFFPSLRSLHTHNNTYHKPPTPAATSPGNTIRIINRHHTQPLATRTFIHRKSIHPRASRLPHNLAALPERPEQSIIHHPPISNNTGHRIILHNNR